MVCASLLLCRTPGKNSAQQALDKILAARRSDSNADTKKKTLKD
jgi:hypothetical protein